MRWQPDPTFYPSPRMAMEAPAEKLAYVAMLNPTGKNGDAMGIVDVDEASKSYGRMVGRVDMPNAGDELHHFGWNACSSCLGPYSPHPHMERRYLVVPGLRSSRIHILDTKPDPRSPELVKVIEPETVMSRTGYSRPHTVHCGPEGIYMNALGSPSGDGPGGVFVLDGETFDVRGPWEMDRGPQYRAEPRRTARVRDQFALRGGGRTILPGWHQGLDDEGRHGSRDRRDARRSEILPAL